MIDMIKNGADGLGRCTTVECIMRSSVEAARSYILLE